MNDRINRFKMFLHNEGYEGMQAFNTRNTAGDAMYCDYDKDGITMDVCYQYEYVEIFGLTKEEWNEITVTNRYTTIRRF